MLRNSKLTDYCIKKIIQCFCIDIPASKTAQLLGKNRNTINRWYSIFRQVIYRHQIALKDKLLGRVEVDESYFGAETASRLSWQTQTRSRHIKTTCIWCI